MTEIRRDTRFANADEVARLLQPSEPVYCLRPHAIAAAAREFVASFPGRTLYAMKCNPHPAVLQALRAGGVDAFDTASLAEIQQIARTFPDARCDFMNPVKPRPAITTARHVHGVRAFAVDHIDELRKLSEQLGHDPETTPVVRLRTEKAEGTVFHLASKFGAGPEDAARLLRAAVCLGFRPGVAFHVGSQCTAPSAYADALRRVRQVLEAAGVRPACVDVGGGFPVAYPGCPAPPLESFMAVIRDGLAALDLPDDCEVLAEPGRALVASGCSLLAQVNLRKDHCLYINDGVFGGLSEVAAAGLRLPARLVRPHGASEGPPRRFSVAGPTCDSLDLVPDLLDLPSDVREGDWIEIGCLGAYASAQATRFNGFRAETFAEVTDPPLGGEAC